MHKVYLVGAGCGSYDLITLRGLEVLKRADCVLYDRLIDLDVLRFVPKHCTLMHVGKANHQHTMSQEQMNKELIRQAERHETVVRLKGGDPYVFGRGGEEALALRQAGISFEVIPGISSCLATLAYAGFPITHRGINTGFHIFSAHTKEDVETTLDYETLAATNDTLVFLMGYAHRFTLFHQLLAHGCPKDRPVALISNGARTTQHVVTSTLAQAHLIKETLESPCTIVIGDVVKLREELNFYETLPLFHKRIFYPSVSADIHTQPLRDMGAIVDEVVCGKINTLPVDFTSIALPTYSYLLFTSRHGVISFMEELMNVQDVRSLAHMTIICIGQKTAEALVNYGLHADHICSQSDSKHMAQLVNQLTKPNTQILLAKARNHNTVLQELLNEQTTIVECYETMPLKQTIACQHYDAMVFTNAFCVHTCMKLGNLAQQVETPVFSIGPSTSIALKQYGFTQIFESETANKQSLFQLIERKLSCIEAED